MEIAKQRPDLLGIGNVVAVVLDVLPEGEGEAVVVVRAGRQFPAGRDHGKIAGREISGNIKVQSEPALRGFAYQCRGSRHTGDHRCGHEMDKDIAAVGDERGVVAAPKAEAAGYGESCGDGASAEVVHDLCSPSRIVAKLTLCKSLSKCYNNRGGALLSEAFLRTMTIGKESVAAIEWDDNYFKYCEFDGFSQDGGVIGSDFINCSFKNVDWY